MTSVWLVTNPSVPAAPFRKVTIARRNATPRKMVLASQDSEGDEAECDPFVLLF